MSWGREAGDSTTEPKLRETEASSFQHLPTPALDFLCERRTRYMRMRRQGYCRRKCSSMGQPLFQMIRTAAGFVFAVAILTIPAVAQPPAQAHYQHNLKRGPAPNGVEQATFFVHRLGTDHAEALTTLDMNGDGRPDCPTRLRASKACVLFGMQVSLGEREILRCPRISVAADLGGSTEKCERI
jgi:hypothetical protein